MAAKLKFGLRIPSMHPADVGALKQFVRKAEELDFDSLWVGDHVFYRVDVLQPLHLLSWVAAQTERVRLGTAIMLTSYLNPVLLAKAASSIDYLSAGRLILGVSLGGTEAEYKSIGVPMDQRVGRLVESIRIMRKLWQEDDVAYAGRYYNVENGTLNPKPVQRPGVPVYLGGNGEATLKRAARLGDGWIGAGGGSVASFIENVKVLRGALAERKRDATDFGFSKLQNVSVHADAAQAKALAEEHWQSYYGPRFNVAAGTILGTPEDCAAQIRRFAEADAPEITLALEPPTLDLEQLAMLREVTRSI